MWGPGILFLLSSVTNTYRMNPRNANCSHCCIYCLDWWCVPWRVPRFRQRRVLRCVCWRATGVAGRGESWVCSGWWYRAAPAVRSPARRPSHVSEMSKPRTHTQCTFTHSSSYSTHNGIGKLIVAYRKFFFPATVFILLFVVELFSYLWKIEIINAIVTFFFIFS